MDRLLLVVGFLPTTSVLWQDISNLSVTACSKSWSVVRLNGVPHFLQVQWIRDDFSLIRLNFSPQLQQTNFFCMNIMGDWVVAFCFLIEVIAIPPAGRYPPPGRPGSGRPSGSGSCWSRRQSKVSLWFFITSIVPGCVGSAGWSTGICHTARPCRREDLRVSVPAHFCTPAR